MLWSVGSDCMVDKHISFISQVLFFVFFFQDLIDVDQWWWWLVGFGVDSFFYYYCCCLGGDGFWEQSFGVGGQYM